MMYFFSQIGLGPDLRGIEASIVGFVIWVIGLVSGLIGFVLNWRSGPRIRKVKGFLGTTALMAALVLWAIWIWVTIMHGFDSSAAGYVPMFALTNTVVAVGALFLPARW